ncbi:TonB-dependent receptor plug domain-containing protein [Algibacillus agarilyticus]|uniref:TonB-dependent receptor plug domain-containing protein n=1 Tax=Algibacillus agarilyticus TaxID=2234133 RepID=UPI000DD0BB05|nr:TonB-dependent receptor [Algibacillus agarilyticus]
MTHFINHSPLTITTILLNITLFSSLAYADHSTDNTDFKTQPHTETIVVTGTRTPKLLSNSPIAVNVIEGAVIDVLSQGTVAQALNFVPGVVVNRNQKDGYTVQMQGFDGDNVLVLLNGQPLIAPTGAAVDLDQISAQDIQQIEVIRGAASVMYGSSAMGGVINIITRQADKNRLKIGVEIGHYTNNAIDDEPLSHLFNINADYIVNNWNNHLNLLIKHSPSFDYDDVHTSTPTGELDKLFLNLGTKGAFNELALNTQIQYFKEEKQKAVGQFSAGTKKITNYYMSNVERYQLDLGLGKDVFNKQKHEIANTSWKLNARLMQHDEISGSSTLRQANIGLYEVNAQHVWSVEKVTSEADLEVVAGGLVHFDTLDQVNLKSDEAEIDDKSRCSVEAFTQLNWIYTDHQYLFGIRAQDDSDFGGHGALSFSSLYDLFTDSEDSLKWRLGIGQGYRVPTLKERFYQFDHSALGYKVYGNKNLEPEESLSFNSTFTYQSNMRSNWLGEFELSSEFNLHYTKAKNLIDLFTDLQQSLAEDLDISVYGNIEEATMQGFNLSAEAQFDYWFTQINYSYLDARDGDHKRLESRPYHQIKTNLGYSNLNAGIDAVIYFVYQLNESFDAQQFSNGEENNSWLTVDFKSTWQLSEPLALRFSIENILDEHQDQLAQQARKFDARPISSRFISIGASYQF